jgi:hypothetical protein
MIKLFEMIKQSTFIKHSELHKYKKSFDELTVTKEGFILRDTRLLKPDTYQDQIISIAYEGHMGIVIYSKQRSYLTNPIQLVGNPSLSNGRRKSGSS